MKVHYATTGNEAIASFRYRIGAPSKLLLSKGIKTSVGPKVEREADIVVFSKHWTFNDASYSLFCRLRGQKIIFDICDDHFDDPVIGLHYNRMCQVAEVITVNSAEMQKIVKNKINRDAVIIPDPVLTLQKPYKEKPPKLLWYGQTMNIKGLYEVYTPECHIPLEVVIPGPINPPEHLQKEWVSWTQWQPNVIDTAAERCSAAIIPYRQGKTGKSANRVLEALNCGLPVLTDPIPSVEELRGAGIFYLNEGIHAAMDMMAKVNLEKEIQMAQDEINKKYSPSVVADQWAGVFNET